MRELLQIDKSLALKFYKALSNLCYGFMENFSYSFRKAQEVLVSNDEIAPHIEAFQIEFKELIEIKRPNKRKGDRISSC